MAKSIKEEIEEFIKDIEYFDKRPQNPNLALLKPAEFDRYFEEKYGIDKPLFESLKQTREAYPLSTTTWRGMKYRCYTPFDSSYKHYGGRGITICKRWRKLENFVADMGERPEGLSIDRIDNDGNYEPGNCRWATAEQQDNNKRRKSGKKD